MSLAVTPAGSVAVDGDRHRARPRLRQRLGGEHVLDLAGADAERQRAERAVGRRVAVAAHDRHARLGEPLLGADDVHDALARVAHRVEPDAELRAVRARAPPSASREIGSATGWSMSVGRDVVVHRGDGEVGPAHGAAGQAQAVERLRRRDLVDEVEIDVEEVGLALAAADDVALPHLLAQRTGGRAGHGLILPGACFTARMASPDLHMGTAKGRWVVAAAVLGSGVAFLDGTVVNAALPAIARDLDADLGDLQWVLTGYLLTLGSLLVLGGSLGDRYGRRRIFVIGLVAFAVDVAAVRDRARHRHADRGPLRCRASPRALLVPDSLAIVSASFATRGPRPGHRRVVGSRRHRHRDRAVPRRLPHRLGVVALGVRDQPADRAPSRSLIALRHVPESRDEHAGAHLDVAGSALLTVGLAGVVYALIEGPGSDWTRARGRASASSASSRSSRSCSSRRAARNPMVPLGIFRSQQFSGANAVTLRGVRRAGHASPSCSSCTCRPTSATRRSRPARRCCRSPRACCCSRRAPARSRSASGRAGR